MSTSSVTLITSSTDSTNSTTSETKQAMHHSQLPKINISKSNAVVIFPENNFCEEPASIEEEMLSFSFITNCPSPIERKMDRYKKLRAMHERAGRLHKSTGNNSN
ncbi:uncharacterized protein OCT59_000026 [Rhizophagus irregularis]|uniref:Uncharacterized protein n=3 Tax=Rhizophagus irregularis TaxID=588596 RepID=A0A915Z1Z8_9GLOM|nr:hypothetical protein RirG_071600 [Rhizophagus irregularis DAOM 197198w]UZN98738.1 hypothetical protein OCT59_000026 [Rhizophagus irregularis]GBC49520.1 hypothetical protein RIR_jg11012.t1 [Rhizophagus irregularis DAOM 181602=DAOM 197198]CAB5359227.1 unnamed protein product [Rhizophagus irregularis]CAG8672741.1 17112_t:CDS:1 [Rhizophagus irregularis]